MGVSFLFFFFSSRRRHTRLVSDWSSDVCSSDLLLHPLDAVHLHDRDGLGRDQGQGLIGRRRRVLGGRGRRQGGGGGQEQGQGEEGGTDHGNPCRSGGGPGKSASREAMSIGRYPLRVRPVSARRG